jgi:hypothetical protein
MSNNVIITTSDGTYDMPYIVPKINYNKSDKQVCLHDTCPECGGTGIKKIGGICVHHLSCPCPKCGPTC